MSEYAARICWNSHGWREPTGEAADLETGSYVTEHGFGHEEWLFDPGAEVSGWQYGFLQPINNSRHKYVGKTIDIRLYAKAETSWFYVGRLPNCEILSDEAATQVWKAFLASGRLARMKAQAAAIGGKKEPKELETPWFVVNIRWRPQTTILFEPLVEAPRHHRIRQLPRYRLYSLTGDSERITTEWPKAGTARGVIAAHTWPDEVGPTATYEGAVRVVKVNAYERDPQARAACIKHFGAKCVVCGMQFGGRYGPEFDGMIHVHHLTPLAALGGDHRVDPIRDLRPLCPNCHAAAHRRDPPYSPQELRELMMRSGLED